MNCKNDSVWKKPEKENRINDDGIERRSEEFIKNKNKKILAKIK